MEVRTPFGPIHDELIRQQALRTRLPQRTLPVDAAPPPSTPAASRAAWLRWIEHTIHPTGFVTIVLGRRAAGIDVDERPMTAPDVLGYVRDVTKTAERILWGRVSRHRALRTNDWCVWLGTHRQAPYPAAVMRGTFLHFSFLVRLRLEPMRVERHASMLPVAGRLARLQEALLRASGSATRPPSRARAYHLADVDAQPYTTAHAELLYREIGPHSSVGDALRSGRLVVLPGATVLRAIERRVP